MLPATTRRWSSSRTTCSTPRSRPAPSIWCGSAAAGRSPSRISESVVGRGHAAIEERLRGSGIKWVILRPGLFMQNVMGQAASIKNDGKMVMSFPKDLPVALIDVRDTGAVGARILIDPAPHAGKVYEFTGKLTTFGEFAEVFSQVLGKPITYVAITPEQAEQGMKSRNMPDWLIAHLVTIAKLGAAGAFSTENTKADRGYRQAAADHDQTIRRGFQGGVCLIAGHLPRHHRAGAKRRDPVIHLGLQQKGGLPGQARQ